MVGAGRTAFDEPHQRGRQVSGPGGGAPLVGDHPQRAPFARQPQHREHEVGPLLPVEPGGAHDQVVRQGGPHRLLAGELAPPVRASRIGRRRLVDRLGRRAVEDIVGAEVAEKNAARAARLG